MSTLFFYKSRPSCLYVLFASMVKWCMKYEWQHGRHWEVVANCQIKGEFGTVMNIQCNFDLLKFTMAWLPQPRLMSSLTPPSLFPDTLLSRYLRRMMIGGTDMSLYYLYVCNHSNYCSQPLTCFCSVTFLLCACLDLYTWMVSQL